MKKIPWIPLLIALFVGFQGAFWYQSAVEKKEDLFLTFDYSSDISGFTDLFYSESEGFSGDKRLREAIWDTRSQMGLLQFKLPESSFKFIRIDPIEHGSGHIVYAHPRIQNGAGEIIQKLSIETAGGGFQLSNMDVGEDSVAVVMNDTTDAHFVITFAEPTIVATYSSFSHKAVFYGLCFFGAGVITYFFVIGIQRVLSLPACSRFLERSLNYLENTSLLRLATFVFAVILFQRFFVFVYYFDSIKTYLSQNNGGDFLTWQYSDIEGLKEHFWRTIYYLQQNPPIPDMIVGFFNNVLPRFAAHYALVLMQGVITAVTCALSVKLLSYFLPKKHLWIGALLALAFGLSSDKIIMEYNWFGQTMYEDLNNVFMMLAFLSFAEFQKTQKWYWVAAVGITYALLALTRATFSYLFPLPLIFLLVATKGFRRMIMVTCVFLLFLGTLQFSWILKNKYVYGYLSPSNSTWAGFIVMTGLAQVGYGEDFFNYMMEHQDRYPEWFIKMHEGRKRPFFWGEIIERQKLMPQDVLEFDQKIYDIVGKTRRYANTMAIKVFSDQYAKVYIDFAKDHPEIILKKFGYGWRSLWRPYKDQAYMFVDPFYVEPILDEPLNIFEAFQKLGPWYGSETVYLNSVEILRENREKIYLFTLNYVPILMRIINLVYMTIIPFALFIMLWYVITGKAKLKDSFLLYLLMVGTVYYLICCVSLVQSGREQCRYRISVDLFIWCLTLINTYWLIFKSKAFFRKQPVIEPESV